MKPVRLGVVLVSTRPGGTELSVLRLLRDLPRDRFEPHVCVLGAEGPLASEYRAAGIPLTALGARGALDFARLLGIRTWIERTDPDILHGFLYASNLLVRAFGKTRRDRRVVISIHGIEQWRPPFLDALERPFWPLANAVLANSGAARRVMIEKFGSRIPVTVVRNGTDPLPVVPRDAARVRLGLGRGPVALCVANFIRYKRHEELIFAFQQVRLAVPGAQLLLTSDGPERARCERVARSLGLQDGVRFLGRRDNLGDLYAACDLVVLASSEESYPGTLLEAAWAGRPVVATAVGGVPELVVEGETGLLVPPLESRPLSQAMIRLLEHPATAARLGAAARRRAEAEFTMEPEIRETMKFYDAVLEGHA